MRMQRKSKAWVFIVSALIGLVGCSDDKKTADVKASTAHTDEHAHPSTGPHGGQLIELGKEEYHVEMLHDDAAGIVTFYVLDGAAKAASPIDTAELTVNLKHDGKAEQFKVAPKPDAADPAGKSSRFVSTDKELVADLDAEGAAAELVVTIAGKQYRGALEHEHEGEAGHKK